MTTSAAALIARSISHTEIASAPYNPDLAADLSADSEDSVEASDTVVEYWGTDEEGAEWRVHLHGDREIEVGEVAEVWQSDDDGCNELCYYVSCEVSVGGQSISVGICVGARESDHGSVRASGAGVRPQPLFERVENYELYEDIGEPC